MRRTKPNILAGAKAAGLFELARSRSARAVRILGYHGLWLGDPVFPGDSLFMRPDTFARRLDRLQALGYPVISLAAAVAGLGRGGAGLPPAAVVITIDDGWSSVASHMWPALSARSMPATLYCDTAQLLERQPVPHVMATYLDKLASAHGRGGRDPNGAARARVVANDRASPLAVRVEAARALGVALGIDATDAAMSNTFGYVSPEELARIGALGLDVQLHTHRHGLGDMSRAAVDTEIGLNRQALSDILGRPSDNFVHFCYPSGLASPAAVDRLARLGLASAVTTERGLAWPGTSLHLLPRLLDGENVSDLEFEAELSGFGDWLRAGAGLLDAWTGRVSLARTPSVLLP